MLKLINRSSNLLLRNSNIYYPELNHSRLTNKSIRNLSNSSISRNWNSSESELLDDSENLTVNQLYQGLISSNRACLARSITLIESTHPRKRQQAQLLLSKALQHLKSLETDELKPPSFRIGIETCSFLSNITIIGNYFVQRTVRTTRCGEIDVSRKYGNVFDEPRFENCRIGS